MHVENLPLLLLIGSLLAAPAAYGADRPIPLSVGGEWDDEGRTLQWSPIDPVATAGAWFVVLPLALNWPSGTVDPLQPGSLQLGDRIDDWGPFRMTLSLDSNWKSWGDVWLYGTALGSVGMFLPVAIGPSESGANKRYLFRAAILSQAWTINLALTNVTKLVGGRARPYTHLSTAVIEEHAPGLFEDHYEEVDGQVLITGHDAQLSWPSGHTSVVSAAVWSVTTMAMLSLPERRPIQFLWFAIPLVVSTTVGISRVRASAHHPSDVISGWMLGTAAGVLIPLAHFRKKPAGPTAVQLMPARDGLALGARF